MLSVVHLSVALRITRIAFQFNAWHCCIHAYLNGLVLHEMSETLISCYPDASVAQRSAHSPIIHIVTSESKLQIAHCVMQYLCNWEVQFQVLLMVEIDPKIAHHPQQKCIFTRHLVRIIIVKWTSLLHCLLTNLLLPFQTMCVNLKLLSLRTQQRDFPHWLEKEGLDRFLGESFTIYLLLLNFWTRYVLHYHFIEWNIDVHVWFGTPA